MSIESENESFNKLIFSGKESEVQKEIESGVDLDQVDLNGWTPLMMAVEGDQPKILELLLKSGANPNKQSDLDGFTPLHLAVDYAIDGMIQNNKTTPYSEPLECIKILVKYGADVKIKTNLGKTIFDFPLTKEILNELRTLENGDAT